MDANEVAKKLDRLGRSDKKHLAALERNRAERCALLTEVVESDAAGLSPDTVATVVQPKDD